MKIALPDGVIFDWDNTLVDSWSAIAEAINYVRAKYGLQTWNSTEIIENCTRSARESFPDWFGDQWEAAWADYYAYFDIVRARIGIHPMNGAADLLMWLYDHKIPTVVVSNKSGDYLRQESAHLGWDKFFISIVGAHDAPRDKPAREHADHALQLAGIKAGPAIWFVGDSEADVACARNTDCTPVLIGTKAAAAKLKVDMVFSDCRELLGLLSDAQRAIA